MHKQALGMLWRQTVRAEYMEDGIFYSTKIQRQVGFNYILIKHTDV